MTLSTWLGTSEAGLVPRVHSGWWAAKKWGLTEHQPQLIEGWGRPHIPGGLEETRGSSCNPHYSSKAPPADHVATSGFRVEQGLVQGALPDPPCGVHSHIHITPGCRALHVAYQASGTSGAKTGKSWGATPSGQCSGKSRREVLGGLGCLTEKLHG